MASSEPIGQGGSFDPKAAVPDEVIGSRIVLRTYRISDAPEMKAAVDESRAQLLPWMVWAKEPVSEQEQVATISGILARWSLREDLTLGMFHRESGRFLGGTGLHRINWAVGAYEIGYWVRVSDTGKGYVTEAVRLLTQTVFETLRGVRVSIHCAESNHRSNAIPQKLGFHREGMLRNTSLDSEGNLHHLVIYSLIAEEWPEVKARWVAAFGPMTVPNP